jgi:hypothetical protein
MDAESVSSVVEVDEEKRALLERIKNASNGPEHAKRRVSDDKTSGLGSSK